MGSSRFDVLIVTALQDELDAVLALELEGLGRDGWSDVRDPEGLPYHIRELPNASGERLRVAVAWAGEMGGNAAATRALGLIHALDPICLAMCGICAGRKGAVALGDVIVADRVFSYDHGKLVKAREELAGDFFHDLTTYSLDPQWAMDAAYLAREFQPAARPGLERPPSLAAQRRWLMHTLHDHERGAGMPPQEHPERRARCPGWTRCIQTLRRDGLLAETLGALELTEAGRRQVLEERLLDPDGHPWRDPPFRVHVAPLATGKAVVEDPALFERLERHVRKVLGAETEAAAIGLVARQTRRKLLIVKAVSDHADSDKDDTFRAFACHASASFMLAFLSRHLRPEANAPTPRPARAPPATFEPGEQDEALRRSEFLALVERACELHHPEGTRITRRPAGPPFGEYLEVTVSRGTWLSQVFPVAALDQQPTEELLAAFIEGIHDSYRRRTPAVSATLVHAGAAAPEALARKAHEAQVQLISLTEYQGLFDFSTYLKRQTGRLETDPIYPPDLYVPQRAQLSIGGGPEVSWTDNVLDVLLELLGSPQPRFALVLGDFGTGKTFLLHELARRLAVEQGPLVPVLIEMRALQKQQSLKALIAQHFAAADIGRLEPDKFLYMLQEGKIALLFDGFDELALRVTYDRVMEHFGTLIEAAQGRAKVIITSRTQHFLTDHDVKRELALRAEVIPGYRLIKLERFNEAQIRDFLVRRLKSGPAADERLAFLRDVRDLLGLSANPRMLSFIVELPPDELRRAREGAGKITSARLYQLLIDRWLKGEHERVNPAGAPRGLSQQQLSSAATELALKLWEQAEPTVDIQALPQELLLAVNARGEHVLDPDVIRHQLGSGSLLVRDEEGRFSFVHQSVLEWLVARKAAEDVGTGRGALALGHRTMSDLMADFFIELAGAQAALRWAKDEAAGPKSDTVQKNALRVLRRLKETQRSTTWVVDASFLPQLLQGRDLRGQNLSEADLRGARLDGADFSEGTFVSANLSSASLRAAKLVRTNLEKANLDGADLADADLSGARLLGATLRSAKLQGARLRGAKLVGASAEGALEGCDVFGAAPPVPVPDDIFPTTMTTSPCFGIAFSPMDPMVATAHSDGSLRFWDINSGAALRVLPLHQEAVYCVAFSPDGALVASGAADGTVLLRGVGSEKTLSLYPAHESIVRGVAFSPDGTLVASCSDDGTARVWDVSNGQELYALTGHTDGVWSVAFSPDGRTIATGSLDRSIILYDIRAAQVLRTLSGHEEGVASVAFSPDGAMLASGAFDEQVLLWNIHQDSPVFTLPGHGEGAESLAFSASGAMLAAGCGDGSVLLWNLEQRQLLRVFKGGGKAIASVAFSPQGALLAWALSNGSLMLRDVDQSKPTRMLRSLATYMLRVTFSPDGATLAAGCADGSVTLWDVTRGQPRARLPSKSEAIHDLAFAPAGGVLATSSINGHICIWQLDGPRLLGRIRPVARSPSCIAFSPDGATLACGAADGSIHLCSPGDGQRLMTLGGHFASVLGIAFSRDGSMLASASADRTITLWALPEGRPLKVLRGHQNDVLSVAFSPDGATLASGSADKTVVLWKAEDGQVLSTYSGLSKGALRLAFSPDGTWLAYADRTLILRRLDDKENYVSLGPPVERVLSLDFSPDGSTLAFVGTDNAIRLWDVAAQRHLGTLLKRPDGWAAFRPDGSFKSGGDLGGQFWHAIGLCRFEPGELDAYLSRPLRLSDDTPLIQRP